MSARRRFAASVALALMLGACGAPAIKSQVLTPPPSSPRSDFFVEKPTVESRETGDQAWQRNATYGRLLADTLKSALQAKGKTLSPPPADIVRTKVYIAYGDLPMKSADRRPAEARVEVRLQLIDPGTGEVKYSTHTSSPIKLAPFGGKLGGPSSADEIIRGVIDKAAQDFVGRL